MARRQTLVQLSDELLAGLDARRAREGRSRSALVRDAVEQYLEDDRTAELERRYVEGYTRIPQKHDVWLDEAARRLIAEEPW